MELCSKLAEHQETVHHPHPVGCLCKYTAFVIGRITPPVGKLPFFFLSVIYDNRGKFELFGGN